MTTILKNSFGYYMKELKNEPYSFVRFGNGEWDCIFKTNKRTGSGSQDLTSQDLRLGMIKATRLERPRYFRAIQSKGYLTSRALWARIEAFAPGARWHPGDVFHHASKNGKLYPLIKYLGEEVEIGLIGPHHLAKLAGILGYKWFIPIPIKDAFDVYSSVRTAILKRDVVDVYSFSAGPMAKLLISELYEVLGDRAWLMDFGSLWDPYCGVKSRGYHKKMSEEILKCNLGQR